MEETRAKNIAIITGASSGIGREFVCKIGNRKKVYFDEVWLIARSSEPLIKLVKRFPEQNFKLIMMDLSRKDSITELERMLSREEIIVRLLVNCAGFGRQGLFEELSLNDQLSMIDVNVKAYTAMAHICLEYMERYSIMINIASLAGFVPQINSNVYSATKAYAVNFSRALRKELEPKGIKVLTVCPGPVDTAFFEEAGEIKSYKKEAMISAKEVVDTAFRDLKNDRGLSIAGGYTKASSVALRLLPNRWLLWMQGFLD